MYKQYIKQAVQMLRENTLVSIISISGTALAIAMVLVMVLVFQIKSTGYAPESNRSRFMYVWGTEVGSKSPGGSDRNRGGMSSEVVKECFYTLRKPEAVSGYCSDSHSLSLPNRRLFKEYEICYTDAGHWKIFDHPFVEGNVSNTTVTSCSFVMVSFISSMLSKRTSISKIQAVSRLRYLISFTVILYRFPFFQIVHLIVFILIFS